MLWTQQTRAVTWQGFGLDRPFDEGYSVFRKMPAQSFSALTPSRALRLPILNLWERCPCCYWESFCLLQGKRRPGIALYHHWRWSRRLRRTQCELNATHDFTLLGVLLGATEAGPTPCLLVANQCQASLLEEASFITARAAATAAWGLTQKTSRSCSFARRAYVMGRKSDLGFAASTPILSAFRGWAEQRRGPRFGWLWAFTGETWFLKVGPWGGTARLFKFGSIGQRTRLASAFLVFRRSCLWAFMEWSLSIDPCHL